MAILQGIGQGASVAITINAVDKFSSTFKAASLGISAVSAAMKVAAIAIAAAGVALATIGTISLKSAAEFETAFTGVRKTVELTEKEFGKLEERFKDITRTTPIAFTEIAHIGELAGQLGVEGVDNIEKFTRTIADISVTTNLTSEQAATDFARFSNIMNMPIEQVDRLGSVVVDLGNNLATTEAEIVEMGMRIAGAGKALNFTEGEVMAWSAALSSVGVQAQMGGTAISKLMINISSMVATGSEDLVGFAEVAGMTTEEFSKAFEDDASAALQTFFNGLGKIKDEGGNVLSTLENLNITEVRLRDSVLRLASSNATLNDALGLQGKAWDENKALVEEAQKRYDTFDSKVQILKNSFSIFKAELGDEFMPVMKDLVIVLTEKVLPALEPLIPILGKFFREAIQSLTPHLEGMATRFVELVDIFLNDLLPVILDVAKTVGGFLVEKIKMLWNIIKPLLPSIMEFARLLFDAGEKILKALLPPLMDLLPVLVDLAKLILENAARVIVDLLPSIERLIPVIIDFFRALEPLIPKLFDLAAVVVEAAIEIARELLPVMENLIPVIMDVIDVVIELVPPIADVIIAIIRLANKVYEVIGPAMGWFRDKILGAVEPIKTIIYWIEKLIGWVDKALGWVAELFGINVSSSSISSDIDNLTRSLGEVSKAADDASSKVSNVIKASKDTSKTRDVIDVSRPSTSSRTYATASAAAAASDTGTGFARTSTGQYVSLDVIKVNDFILSKGKLIQPSSQDTIIGTKNPEAMGGVTLIIEGDVNGVDPEQMAEAFGRELKRSIRI